MTQEKIESGNQEPETKIKKLEKIVTSEPVKYIAMPTAIVALGAALFYFGKKYLYDPKPEDTKRKYKRVAVDMGGGAAGAAFSEVVNPYKDTKS